MTPPAPPDHRGLGLILVAGSALLWSFGGVIARFITLQDVWAIVFWRSLFGTTFLLGFLLWRDGAGNTVRAFRSMGAPGLLVAACFCTASMSFVIALSHTTVANILLMQAGVPLLAALLSWLMFRERTPPATWVAILIVLLGVGIMVSGTFTGKVSPIGDGLSLLIAVAFALATVTTRRHRHIQMVPATALAVGAATVVSACLAGSYRVGWPDIGWLAAFGTVSLGLGLALFSLGARLLPAAVAALVGVLEPVMGPIWVWLVHGEVPQERTLYGGALVFFALLGHILYEMQRSRRA